MTRINVGLRLARAVKAATRTHPEQPVAKVRRYRADDSLLAFLKSL